VNVGVAYTGGVEFNEDIVWASSELLVDVAIWRYDVYYLAQGLARLLLPA
jgi:hypothetical protein